MTYLFHLSHLLVVCLFLVSTVQAQVIPRETESARERGARLARDAARRGEQLRRSWKTTEAEALFREAATASPTSLEAALGLARIARARFEYKEAIRLLDRAQSAHPLSAELTAEYGLVYLSAEDPARARHYFTKAINLDRDLEAAITGQAGAYLLERDYARADSVINDYLKQNPLSSRAYAVRGRILLETNQADEAERSAERALAIDEYDTDAYYTLAFVKATKRKPDEVRALARRALALDPLNFGCRRLLSQYLDGQVGYRQTINEAARTRVDQAQSLKRAGRTIEAVRELEAALAIEPRYYLALVALGDVWLREGDYERAATAARLALEVDAEGALAHLELSYSHWGLQERSRIEIGATDFSALFYKQPRVRVFQLTAEVFPNYRSLGRRHREVIDRAVSPLGRYLPKLVRGGARHHLLPFDQRVTDIGGLDDISAEKTFDGRYYASVRGVGGRVTVSGLEYIETAALGGFNTIAHEFAHQVHMVALDKEETRQIAALYEKARQQDRLLDYYAAANEFEYFAQAYEAFISTHKRPSAGVTARHTRLELQARDPEMYRFLLKLTGQPAASAAP